MVFFPFLLDADTQSQTFKTSNLVLAFPSKEILKWLTNWLSYIQTLYLNESHTHMSKTEFDTSFIHVNMSDFDIYIPKKYPFIPLLV